MSSMESEIRVCLRNSLSELLDDRLESSGFSRRKNSLSYWRKLPECNQRIEVCTEVHTKDDPNSSAAVYPLLEVSMDEVNTIAAQIARGNEMFHGPWTITLLEPIDLTAPKGVLGRWFLYQPDSVPGVASEMREFMDRWTIPFLDYYATPHAVCDAYDRDDQRALYGKMGMVYVAAAMLLEGRKEDAMAVAERYYGKPGIRKGYANVFAYIESFTGA